MTPLRHQQAHEDHTSIRNGTIEPFEDFDFAAVDRSLSGDAPTDDPHLLAGEALHKILSWVWDAHESKPDLLFPIAFRRFCAVSAAINPAWVGTLSYKQIGEELGLTKQAVCRTVMLFSDEFKHHFRRSKREGARQHMRDAQRGHPQSRFKANLASPTHGKGHGGGGGA